MGKMDRLRNKVEPFAALFWALGIVLSHHSDPASLHRRTGSMSLYGHVACMVVESWFNSQ